MDTLDDILISEGKAFIKVNLEIILDMIDGDCSMGEVIKKEQELSKELHAKLREIVKQYVDKNGNE